MKSHHLEALMVKRAEVTNGHQVRYKVYQSPTEFIAVIAESALLAIRISGVKNPYKIVRDLPTAGASVEKGALTVPESIEKVPLPFTKPEHKPLQAVMDEQEDPANAFLSMTLGDLYNKKAAHLNILSPEAAMKMFGASEEAPTLTAPAPSTPKPIVPEVVSVAPPEPVSKPANEALSQEEIAKLLGDI
jgi:hypothetical protein